MVTIMRGTKATPEEITTMLADNEREKRAEEEIAQRKQMQTAPETGEWHVEAMPIHGWRVVDATGQEIVADVYRKEDAEQIVADHNAVPRLAAIVLDESLPRPDGPCRCDDDYDSKQPHTARCESIKLLLATLHKGV